MAAVEVVGDPPGPPVGGRDACDDGHEQRAEVVAEGDGGERERGAHAAHGVRRLVVEELELPDEGENLGGPDNEVLRHLPEDGQRHLLQVVVVVPANHTQAHALQRPGSNHGEDGDDEADAHARELREPSLVAGDPASRRDDDAVVEGDPHDDTEHVEDGERRRRNLEMRAHAGVQRVALQDEHGAHLAVHRGEDDAAGPYREQPHHRLQLLHLRHRALPPGTTFAGVHSSSVQEPELFRVLELPAAFDRRLLVAEFV